MPTSRPAVSTSAPPELPWLMGASVCRKSSKLPSPTPVARPLALTMPIVTVWPTPRGLPNASTTSPTRVASESPNGERREAGGLHLQHGQVARRVGADDLRVESAAVGQVDLHLLRPVDDVVVGQHVAVGADDDARAEATFAVRPRVARREPEAAQERRQLARVERHRRRLDHPLGADGDDGRGHARDHVGVPPDAPEPRRRVPPRARPKTRRRVPSGRRDRRPRHRRPGAWRDSPPPR